MTTPGKLLESIFLLARPMGKLDKITTRDPECHIVIISMLVQYVGQFAVT